MDTEPDKEYTASLMQTMYQLSQIPFLVDFVVKIRGRKWKCHKAIIFAKSKQFVHLCESDTLEAVLGEIVAPEKQADIVDSLMKFLYLGNCDITADNVSSLLRVAKRIKLNELQKKCEKYLAAHHSKEELKSSSPSSGAVPKTPTPSAPTPRPADSREEILILGGVLPGSSLHPNIVFLEKDASVAALPAAPMFATVQTQTLSACFNKDFLIVSGGYDLTTKRSVATVQIFDVSRKRWSNLPDLPYPVHAHGTVLVNGNMYSLGGRYGENGQIKHRYDSIHRIELPAGKWTEFDVWLPSAVSEPGIAAVEDDIVIVGGNTDSGKTSRTSRFNTKSKRLTRCQSMPEADVVPTSTVADAHCIYVLSGQQFLCYDLCSDSWSSLAMPMKPCYDCAMVLKQHRLIAMGGYDVSGDHWTNPNDRVQVYDLKTRKWEAQKNMPLKLTFHWAVVMKL